MKLNDDSARAPGSPRAICKTALSAFTLVELLVVIAIISLLAAILFPVFARARENARRASCQSNLKQIGIGMMQYVQDCDEKFPTVLGDKDPTLSSRGEWWQSKIFPYIRNAQVYVCPSRTSARGTPLDPASMNPDVPYTSYAICDVSNANWACSNSDLTQFTKIVSHSGWFHNDGYNNTNNPATEMDVPKPSETFMVVEMNDYNVYSTGNIWNDTHLDWGNMTATGFHTATAANCTTSATKMSARHFSGANYLYADGHVKWHLSGTVRAANYTLQDD